MLVLCYNSRTHDVEVDRDGVKSTVSIGEARKLFESDQVDDCTLSWSRLVQFDYDADAVEQFYHDADKQRRS